MLFLPPELEQFDSRLGLRDLSNFRQRPQPSIPNFEADLQSVAPHLKQIQVVPLTNSNLYKYIRQYYTKFLEQRINYQY